MWRKVIRIIKVIGLQKIEVRLICDQMIHPKYIAAFVLGITISFSSCRFLEEKQKESDDAIDSTSLVQQIMEGHIEPKNHEVFKHLMQMKHLLPKPTVIPRNTVERENPVFCGHEPNRSML